MVFFFKSSAIKFLVIFSVALLSIAPIKESFANKLMVTPTRIEFEGRTRTQEVKLINRGDEETSYRISFQHLRMNENGSYSEIKEGDEMADEKFIDDIIRYSPRRVTLKPGEVQIIRLMLRRSKSPDGEYRSHMLFREEAPADFGTNIERSQNGDNKISIVLKPLFGISIPVIATIGKAEATATIQNVEVRTDKEKNKNLYVKIKREGNASIYGDIIATFTPKNSNKKHEIGIVNGVSAFYPYDSRDILIRLDVPDDINLKGGSLNVVYYAKQKNNSSTDRNNILAQKTIIAP